MIVDTVEHLHRYRSLSPSIATCIAFLDQRADRAETGRHDLPGGEGFANVEMYHPQPASSKRWEAHRRHVDVQVVLRGVEWIGYAPLDALSVAQAYDAETDVTWLTGRGDFVRVAAGMFMILQPHDAHMPGVAAQAGPAGGGDAVEAAGEPVRKVVFKLPEADFTAQF